MERLRGLFRRRDLGGDRQGYCRRDNLLTRCCPLTDTPGSGASCMFTGVCFLWARTTLRAAPTSETDSRRTA